MTLLDFIEEGYLIIVAVLYVLGIFIKQTTLIRDEYIPIVLMIFGILGSLSINYSIPDAIFQGILCAGVAILGNQTIKQFNKLE